MHNPLFPPLVKGDEGGFVEMIGGITWRES